MKDYRETEDANARSGAGRLDPPSGSFSFEVHEAMGVMMGERASTRPKCVMGSGIPVSLDGDHRTQKLYADAEAKPTPSTMPEAFSPPEWPAASMSRRPPSSRPQNSRKRVHSPPQEDSEDDDDEGDSEDPLWEDPVSRSSSPIGRTLMLPLLATV